MTTIGKDDYRPLIATRYRFKDAWFVYCRKCTGLLAQYPWGPDETEQVFDPDKVGAPECWSCAAPFAGPKTRKEVPID